MLLNIESPATYISNLFFCVSDCRISHTRRVILNSVAELKVFINQRDNKTNGSGMPFASVFAGRQ